MPRCILVPTDFSPASGVALQAAAELAAGTGASLLLLHVRGGPPDEGRAAEPPSQAPGAALDPLAASAAEVMALGTPVRTIVAEPGEPAPAILLATREADLVVAAPRSGAGDRPGLGRTAATVAKEARCPVLFVSPGEGSALRVRVAVDLSERSAEALRAARRLVAARGGVVEAFHAVADEVEAALWGGEPVEASDDLPAERQLRRLARFVAAAGGPDVPVALHMAEGPRAAAVDRLAHAASEPPVPPATP